MKATLYSAILAGVVALVPTVQAEEAACTKLSETVKRLVTAESDNVLKIVEQQTAANPGCSCEVVKAAILATEADRKLVGQIVATAIEAAPDKMRVITSCAVAVAPDALPEIKAVLAKLAPKALAKKGNDPVADGAKDAGSVIVGSKVKNPLDGPYLIPGLPPIHPPIIPALSTTGRDITFVNPAEEEAAPAEEPAPALLPEEDE